MKRKRIWWYECISNHGNRGYFLAGIIVLLLYGTSTDAMSQYLKRSLSAITEVRMELSSPSAHYSPMFGAGGDSSDIIKGLRRFGYLSVDPSGRSNNARYPDEEHVLFVLEGTGIINYNRKEVPVCRNDFIYLPRGTKFGFSNAREKKLSVLIMGFRIMPDSILKPSKRFMIASADEVPLQVLGSHGPTTQFQLLLGTTESTRDRLAAACQVNSLFIMDFAANGTNIPHRHEDEEEIYFILKGNGEIVAGEPSDGKENRHPSGEGDAYFFSPGTLIGFYSENTEGKEHARILAVRFKYPAQMKSKSGNK